MGNNLPGDSNKNMKKVVNIKAFVDNEMENNNYNDNQELLYGDGEGLPTSNENTQNPKRNKKKPNLSGFKYLKGIIELNPKKMDNSEECDGEYVEQDQESKVSNFSNFQMENEEERDNDKENNINKRESKYSAMTKAKKIVKTFLTKRIQKVM